MGGALPLGYEVHERKLVVNHGEAQTVKQIFERYLELGSVRLLTADLGRRGIVSGVKVSKHGNRRGGKPFSRGALYCLLSNPIYVGEIRHRRISYPGQHEPIVERSLWQRVQEMLKQKAARRGGGTGRRTSGFLVGRMFDENGEPLYACWAKKGDRRYRYFVSRKLVRGNDKNGERGWRLPAEETEHAVMGATRRMLLDRGTMASALKAGGLGAAELKQALEIVERKVRSVDGIGSEDGAGGAGSLIERVELQRDDMQITLNLRALVPVELVSDRGASLRITRVVQMQMKRRGVETRLVIPGEAVQPSQSNPALLRALARGYLWFGELASGSVASTIEIAIRERLSHSYVRHVVPLGLLAPRLIEAICAGQQSVTISAERLKNHWRLPIEWDAQERLLSD